MANGLSLRPSTFTAGGLIDDIDATIKRARFVRYDYDGKADKEALCLLLQLEDSDGTDHVQYFSAGDLSYFVPSEDPKHPDLSGVTCVPVGDKTALNGGTNAAIMLNSLVQAGFPEDKLDEGDLRALEGMVVHWNRVPQPKRSGIAKKDGQREPMVLVVTAIKSMPGEGKTAASASKGKPGATAVTSKASPAPATSNGTSDELKDELTSHLIGLFAEKGVTEMKKVDISKSLFSYIEKADPNRNKLVSLASKDDVLKSLDGFSYNGSVLTQE